MEYSPPPCSFNYQQYGKGGDKFLQKCLADTYVTEKATPRMTKMSTLIFFTQTMHHVFKAADPPFTILCMYLSTI